MPDIDALLSPEARYFAEHVASERERIRIRETIDIIRRLPDIDYVLRFPFDAGSGTDSGIIYNDGDIWVTCRMVNEWTLEIVGIGTVGDAPP